MSILKIQEAGEELTLELTAAEIVEGNFGQQVKFEDKNGDVLYVPLSSVERQLDRCGVAEVSDLTGKSIHFSRAASNKPGGKPFWNLDKARNGDAVKTNGAAPKASAPKAEAYESPGRLPNEDFRELVLRYRECAAAANEAWGKDTSDQALVAAAATLFIERNRKNV
jgi:hypothetical protein